MKEEKKQQLDELFNAGRWTDFLREMPDGTGMTFKFNTTGQIMTLKVVAARLSQKPDATRQYSVRGVNYEKLTAFVEVIQPKNNGN